MTSTLIVRDEIPGGHLVPFVVVLHAIARWTRECRWRISQLSARGDVIALFGKGMVEFERDCADGVVDLSFDQISRLSLLVDDVEDLRVEVLQDGIVQMVVRCVDSSVWEFECPDGLSLAEQSQRFDNWEIV